MSNWCGTMSAGGDRELLPARGPQGPVTHQALPDARRGWSDVEIVEGRAK
jgi:hypothetical protein